MNSTSVLQNMKSLVVAICIIFLPVDKSFGQLTWVQSDKIVPEGAMNGDQFGVEIDVRNSVLLVGSPGNDNQEGIAYLFDLRNGQLLSTLLPDESEFSFFGFEVALNDEFAAVTANGSPLNSVYLFNIATGQQIHSFNDPNIFDFTNFGIALAFGENSILISASNADPSGSVFVYDLTTKLQTNELVPMDTNDNISFGSSVDVDGQIAIIGADNDRTNGLGSGAAYLFDLATGMQLHKLLPSDGDVGDSFGSSVGIAGSFAVVGSPQDDDNGTFSGSAYLFDVSTGKQLAKLLPDDAGANSFFGTSVSIDGSIAIIGAFGSTENGMNRAGSAFLFDVNSGKQLAKILPNDGTALDRFGRAVVLDGATTICGALNGGENDVDSGAVYKHVIDYLVEPTQFMPVTPVGNAGNKADATTGFGDVDYEYEIGIYETTNRQYVEFLNSVAATDTHSLFNPNMESDQHGGIIRIGSPGTFSYLTKPGFEQRPVNFVGYWDAARFANWLHNGQPTGVQDLSTTESGAYLLNGVTFPDNITVLREPDAIWFIPSENEWYKAAYYWPSRFGGDQNDYFEYPMPPSSPSASVVEAELDEFGNVLNPGGFTANHTSSSNPINTVSRVGAVGAGSISYYGTYDQGGNVFEWTEAINGSQNQIVRGGHWADISTVMRSDIRQGASVGFETAFGGFRIARRASLAKTPDLIISSDPYNVLPIVGYAGGGFFIETTIDQSALPVAFNNISKCLGENLFGLPGDRFEVREEIDDLGMNTYRISIDLQSLDAMGTPTPWIPLGEVAPTGEPFTSFGIVAGIGLSNNQFTFGNGIDFYTAVDIAGFSISTYAADESHIQNAFFPRISSNSTPYELREAIILSGPDIAGLDRPRIRLSWILRTPFEVGDINMDGNVNLLDVDPFVEALAFGQFVYEADVNQDGALDTLDIGAFVQLLAGQ